MKILADKVGEYVLYSGVYPSIPGIDKANVMPIRELSDDEIRSGPASSRRSSRPRKQFSRAILTTPGP